MKIVNIDGENLHTSERPENYISVKIKELINI